MATILARERPRAQHPLLGAVLAWPGDRYWRRPEDESSDDRPLQALPFCSPAPAALADDAAPKSLYQRLGGQDAITAVVDRFVANLSADERIAERFGMTNPDRRKRLLVEQICEATGGPCKYSGRDMKSAHAGHSITQDEFDWTAAHLVEALDHFEVPAQEKGELVAIVTSMQGDIVDDD